jgi:hypothetical protein
MAEIARFDRCRSVSSEYRQDDIIRRGPRSRLAILRRTLLKTGSKRTSSLSRFQLIQKQSCSVRRRVLILLRSLVAPYVMTVRVPAQALGMQSIRRMIHILLMSGMMSTDSIRITSGSIPMQPSRFAESTCIKCHHSVTELGVNPKFGASAPKVVKGYELIQKYGCLRLPRNAWL